jgi:hypothetical protein
MFTAINALYLLCAILELFGKFFYFPKQNKKKKQKKFLQTGAPLVI